MQLAHRHLEKRALIKLSDWVLNLGTNCSLYAIGLVASKKYALIDAI